MYTVYVTFVYKYVSILQYFSVLSFLLHIIILFLSSFSKKLSSYFLESRVMLCMFTLYFKRCTLYKFIEINSVLFLKRYAIYIINQVYFVLIDRTFVSDIFNNSISEKKEPNWSWSYSVSTLNVVISRHYISTFF